MSKQGDIFNDLSKLVMGAAGAARSAQKEAETLIQEQFRKYGSSADWVTREEFDMVREAALSAHEQVKVLSERVAELEKAQVKKSAKPARKPARKTAAGKSSSAAKGSSTGKSSKK